MAEWGLGPFQGDCASDEKIEVIEYLTGRINDWTSGTEFDAVDIPGARANLAMLAAILKECGGHIEEGDIDRWHKKVLEPFSESGHWSYSPWPDEKKESWRAEIENTFAQLRSAAGY